MSVYFLHRKYPSWTRFLSERPDLLYYSFNTTVVYSECGYGSKLMNSTIRWYCLCITTLHPAGQYLGISHRLVIQGYIMIYPILIFIKQKDIKKAKYQEKKPENTLEISGVWICSPGEWI